MRIFVGALPQRRRGRVHLGGLRPGLGSLCDLVLFSDMIEEQYAVSRSLPCCTARVTLALSMNNMRAAQSPMHTS